MIRFIRLEEVLIANIPTDLYPVLFRMRPGVTSRATIYNGYTDTMEKMLIRLEMDLAYYEERTWLLDIRLLVLTFLKIVGGKKF